MVLLPFWLIAIIPVYAQGPVHIRGTVTLPLVVPWAVLVNSCIERHLSRFGLLTHAGDGLEAVSTACVLLASPCVQAVPAPFTPMPAIPDPSVPRCLFKRQ